MLAITKQMPPPARVCSLSCQLSHSGASTAAPHDDLVCPGDPVSLNCRDLYDAVHLTERTEFPLVTSGIDDPFPWKVLAKTCRFSRFAELTVQPGAEVVVPMEDDDIKGDGRWHVGGYGFEESRCSFVCGNN